MKERTLYVFPISHYCEKASWCLDKKKLPYVKRVVIPGLHRFTMRGLSRKRTVPLLVEGDTVLADSMAIAMHIEERHPNPPLLPSREDERARVLELTKFFDEHAGPAVRRWLYGQLLEEKGAAPRALFRAYPAPARLLGRLLANKVEDTLRRQYRIFGDEIEASHREILAALDRIERETGGDARRYLVGDALTLADVTAAALLAPIIAPPGSPWESHGEAQPKAIASLRDRVRARPAGAWLLERYLRDRA